MGPELTTEVPPPVAKHLQAQPTVPD